MVRILNSLRDGGKSMKENTIWTWDRPYQILYANFFSLVTGAQKERKTIIGPLLNDYYNDCQLRDFLA